MISGPLTITIEGPQGSGKSVLAKRIAQLIRDLGLHHIVVLEDEPADSVHPDCDVVITTRYG